MLQPVASSALVAFLSQADEHGAVSAHKIATRTAVLDYLQSALAQHPTPSAEALHHLQCARALPSATLQRSEGARIRWIAAQELLVQWSDREVDELLPTLSQLQALNGVLCGTPAQATLRTVPIFSGRNAHPDAMEVPGLLDEMLAFLQTCCAAEHPVQVASRLRQWLLAIHPFTEANGRTSQLVADLVLARAGFLPQSFSSILDVMLLGMPGHRSFMTPYRAFFRFADSVEHSYSILLNRRMFFPLRTLS